MANTELPDHEGLDRIANRMPVTREPGFARLYADEAWALNLGRDLDVGFFAMSPRLVERRSVPSESNEMLSYALGPNVVEVARVRMSPHCAMQTVVSIMSQMIIGEHVNVDKLSSQLSELIEVTIAQRDAQKQEETS